MANGSGKYQLYLNWANSILNETKQSIRGLGELQDGRTLCSLVDILWPAAKLGEKIKDLDDPTSEACLQVVLSYLSSTGIKHSLNDKDIVGEDLRPLCELIWIIIINFCVHTPKLAAFQRNVRVGSRLVLNWCREQVPSMSVNHTESLVNNIRRDLILIDLLKKYCTNITYSPDVQTYLDNCLQAAEEELGVRKGILDSEKLIQGTISEDALLIYLTLLRRKVKQRENQLAVTCSRRQLVGVPAPSHKLAWTF